MEPWLVITEPSLFFCFVFFRHLSSYSSLWHLGCVLSIWGKIIIPAYRLWLYSKCGPWCPRKLVELNRSPIHLSSLKPIRRIFIGNFVKTEIKETCSWNNHLQSLHHILWRNCFICIMFHSDFVTTNWTSFILFSVFKGPIFYSGHNMSWSCQFEFLSHGIGADNAIYSS